MSVKILIGINREKIFRVKCQVSNRILIATVMSQTWPLHKVLKSLKQTFPTIYKSLIRIIKIFLLLSSYVMERCS